VESLVKRFKILAPFFPISITTSVTSCQGLSLQAHNSRRDNRWLRPSSQSINRRRLRHHPRCPHRLNPSSHHRETIQPQRQQRLLLKQAPGEYANRRQHSKQCQYSKLFAARFRKQCDCGRRWQPDSALNTAGTKLLNSIRVPYSCDILLVKMIDHSSAKFLFTHSARKAVRAPTREVVLSGLKLPQMLLLFRRLWIGSICRLSARSTNELKHQSRSSTAFLD
jgi:hypothetical protein